MRTCLHVSSQSMLFLSAKPLSTPHPLQIINFEKMNSSNSIRLLVQALLEGNVTMIDANEYRRMNTTLNLSLYFLSCYKLCYLTKHLAWTPGNLGNIDEVWSSINAFINLSFLVFYNNRKINKCKFF